MTPDPILAIMVVVLGITVLSLLRTRRKTIINQKPPTFHVPLLTWGELNELAHQIQTVVRLDIDPRTSKQNIVRIIVDFLSEKRIVYQIEPPSPPPSQSHFAAPTRGGGN